MKRLSVLLLSAAVLLSACSWLPSRQRDEQARAEAALAAARQPTPRITAADGTPIVTSDGVEIEKVEFRAGVSSAVQWLRWPRTTPRGAATPL